MTGKEFAALRGVHPSRVSQWKRQGRLVFDGDGRIDAEASNKGLDASLDQVKGARRTGNVTSSAPAAAVAGDPPAIAPRQGSLDQAPEAAKPAEERGGSAKDDSNYWENKSRREKAEAQLSEMRALQAAGALVPAAVVKREATELGRQLRNALLAIPDRIAPVLDTTNPARAHKLVTDEIQRVLNELRVGLEQRAAAAARTDEREPALL